MSQTTSRQRQRCRSTIMVALMLGMAWGGFTVPVSAQTAGVCEGKTCDNLPTNICDAGGFKVTQKSYTPASGQNNGMATYTYEICSPAAGLCSGGDGTKSCLSNDDCTKGGNPPGGTCSRECAVNTFRGLSHFDIFFPELGVASCLTGKTDVTGSCAITTNTSGQATVGGFVLGDGSIENVCGIADPDNNNNADKLAKCESTELAPGDCLTMTLNIAGETNGLGLGTAVVLSKESTDCNESCLAGPSCERCDTTPPGGAECLTRTLGFWGTHPWITNNYATDASPVSVCWKSLDCDDTGDGKSNPACNAGSCDSVMEGLGSTPGIELPTNQPYVSMIKQLTAAKLNLKATAALKEGATCSSWIYEGKTIQQWIDYCEGTFDGTQVSGGYCGAGKSQISGSGCIEALNAFNNSQDTGFAQTPPPFDRPSVDDYGNVSGADPSQFNLAQGNSTPPGKWVIGKKVGDNDCRY